MKSYVLAPTGIFVLLFVVINLGNLRAEDHGQKEKQPMSDLSQTDKMEDVKAEEKPKLDPMQEAQFKSLRSVLKVELSFLNRVCNLSEDQLAKAISEGKTCLVEEIKRTPQRNPQVQLQLRRVVQLPNGTQLSKIESTLQERFEQLLTEDQKKEYKSELEKLESFTKLAVVDSLVSMLDLRLNLNEDQRAKISESLMEEEESSRLPSLQTIQNYGRYFPNIPNSAIVPHLNEDQEKVFRGITKVTYSSHINPNDDQFVIDDIDLNE